jgi:hypothetical protein
MLEKTELGRPQMHLAAGAVDPPVLPVEIEISRLPGPTARGAKAHERAP